jgi:hydroxymethylglutaryl-CoA reductase (NADPH)
MAKQDTSLNDISLRSFDVENSPEIATKKRRDYVSSRLGVDLELAKTSQIDPAFVSGKNIENLVGEVSLPLGLAGPITIHGDYASGRHYLPCATTEGTLVASISRGSKALSLSGGVKVSVAYNGISRAPLFELSDTKDVKKAEQEIKRLFADIAKVAASTSNHLKLTAADTFSLGKYLWLRMSFDTQEAMGMNMATIVAIRKYVC